MSLLNFVKRRLSFVLAVTIAAPGFASDPNIPENPAAVPANAGNISLWELSVGGNKLLQDKHTGRFVGHGQDIGVAMKAFEAPNNGAGIYHITVTIAGVDHVLDLHPQKAEFEKQFNYDPETSGLMATFVKELFAKTYSEHQRFNARLDINGVGDLSFLFSRPRTIRYGRSNNGYSLEYKHERDAQQKTVYKIYYGFEGDPATNFHELCSIDHDDDKVPCPATWYVDYSGCLKSVLKVDYDYPPAKWEDWYNSNGLSNGIFYTRLKSDNEVGRIISPPPESYGCLEVVDAREKYYRGRFNFNINEDLIGWATNYLYVDAQGGLKRVQLWKYWCVSQNENKIGESIELLDTTNENGELVTCKLAVIKPTETSIERPSYNGCVQNGTFQPGYYMLVGKQELDNRLVQRWQDQATNGEVTVTISGVRNNGQWAPLIGLPHIQPVVVNGKTVLDLSNDLQNFSEANWTSLKQYLLTLYWVERQHPVLKYHYPNDRFSRAGEVGAKLNEFIEDVNCFDLDLDGGWFLVQQAGSWFLKDVSAFKTRNDASRSTWLIGLYPSDTVNLIKQRSEITALDITGIAYTYGTLPKFLADHQPIKSVVLGEINAKHLVSLGLTHVQVMNLVSKAQGLTNLNLEDFPKAACNPKGLLNCLVNNRDSLETLDLNGVNALGSEGEDFVKIVTIMNKLRVLYVQKTKLSNGQIIALAEVISRKNLTEVGLTMPYHISNVVENEARLISNATTLIKKSPLNTLVAVERNLLPLLLGWPLDILFDAAGLQGKDYEDVCKSLAKASTLKTVKLHLKNWIKYQDWTRKEINRLRKSENSILSDLSVEFVN
jgi:hypothetical protein